MLLLYGQMRAADLGVTLFEPVYRSWDETTLRRNY
jgi:hypothetical protein